MLDFNDAGEQYQDGIIPDGTFVKVRSYIRPGAADGLHPNDHGLLRASTRSDARMLDFEFTILSGPHAKRKIWQMLTISGGKLNEKGESSAFNVSKKTLRAMLDSAHGIDPNDNSEAAKAKRRTTCFRDFDGLEFVIKVGIEYGNDQYPDDKNNIARVVVPGEAEYQPVMQDMQVPPKPSSRRKAASRAAPAAAAWQQPSAQPPAWAASAAPAAVQQPTLQMPGGAAGPSWLNNQS